MPFDRLLPSPVDGIWHAMGDDCLSPKLLRPVFHECLFDLWMDVMGAPFSYAEIKEDGGPRALTEDDKARVIGRSITRDCTS